MIQYVDVSTCHTPIRLTLWPNIFYTYSRPVDMSHTQKVDTLTKYYLHIHDSICRCVDMSHTNKVDTLIKHFLYIFMTQYVNLSTCHTPIRSTLLPMGSIHIHYSICRPVDMSHTQKVNTLTKYYLHIHDPICRRVDMSHTHKVDTLIKHFLYIFMNQYVNLSTCHTPHNVDTLTKILSTYPWFNMSTCRHVTHQ